VDSHLHLWDRGLLKYSWMDGLNLPSDFGPNTYLSHTTLPSGVILVEAAADFFDGQCLKEAKWFTQVAQENPAIPVKAIVACVLMEKGEEIQAQLEELKRIPLVKGVRRVTQGEKPDFLLSPQFRRGVELAASFGFSVDICLKGPEQFDSAIQLIKDNPQVTFILDHIGKPLIKEKILDPWKKQISEVAGLTNVYCKISGVITEADHEKWTVEDLKPYVLHAFHSFGPDRVMFGSDYPVALMAVKDRDNRYKCWIDALNEILKDIDDESKQKLFSLNAKKVYRF